MTRKTCLTLFRALALCSVIIQFSDAINADLVRIFSVVEGFRCADGFITIKQQGCIVRCINETDPTDIVEPYVLHEKFSLKGCCTHTTYMNEDFECTVVDCKKTELCPYAGLFRSRSSKSQNEIHNESVESENEYPR